MKFHYTNSIALAKDTKRKKDTLDETSTVQAAISEFYSPMNEDTNNPYPLSILTKDKFATPIENVQSNLKNSAIITTLLDQTVVKKL